MIPGTRNNNTSANTTFTFIRLPSASVRYEFEWRYSEIRLKIIFRLRALGPVYLFITMNYFYIFIINHSILFLMRFQINLVPALKLQMYSKRSFPRLLHGLEHISDGRT